ncbi:MAG: hypothetical protein KJO82_09855, partial [Gammaproteobacteria bacterium]|nr:hypothetical protein [Gammaproteobacteria bacterium]
SMPRFAAVRLLTRPASCPFLKHFQILMNADRRTDFAAGLRMFADFPRFRAVPGHGGERYVQSTAVLAGRRFHRGKFLCFLEFNRDIPVFLRER